MISIDPQIIIALRRGDVISYPTEAVFGLGCDPDNLEAVNKILKIKQRPLAKGLILIAANYAQLQPYVDDSKLSDEQRQQLKANEQPTTYVMPAAKTTPKWLTGDFTTIAVRISAHPVVQQLCLDFGKPLVSTSANLHGEPAIVDPQILLNKLGDKISFIVPGLPNPKLKPSTIIDAVSGVIYRQ
jgi:L-threonylcarbamoyladenylate synthase